MFTIKNEQYEKEMFESDTHTVRTRNFFRNWLIVCLIVFVVSVAMFIAGITDHKDLGQYKNNKEIILNNPIYYGIFGCFVLASFVGIILCSIEIYKKNKNKEK